MPTIRPSHVGLLLCTLGCSEATGAFGDPAGDATYVLESVDGCTPGQQARECFPRPSWVIDGTMVLEADGRVTRTVTYQTPNDAGPVSQIAVGSYSQVGNLVLLELRENAGTAGHVWRPSAVVSGDKLILRYPHPADGETVEVFRRA